jgi:O-antigen/teichoic acid export membrane protein
LNESRSTFLREGGWMTLATVVSGAAMMLVHSFAAQPLGPEEYATVGTLLRILLFLAIPGAGLQVLFARQTAAAGTEGLGGLARITRATLGLVTAGWLVVAMAVWGGHEWIQLTLKLNETAILWPTLGAAWASLALPLFSGLVQGRERFGTLGMVSLANGFGRLGALVALVVVAHGKSTSAMWAAFVGLAAAAGVAAWGSREVWLAKGTDTALGPVLKRLGPFTLSVGCLLMLSQSDVIFLTAVLPADSAARAHLGSHYLPASTIGFAMTQFTVPLALVMFPKIARSFARSEKSDALQLALTGTALVGGIAALAATVLPKLPLQILYLRSPDNWAAAPLVPWCAWAMFSFALANLIVGDRMARADFRFLPWAVALTAGFLATLGWLAPQLPAWEAATAYRALVGTIGGFNLALLAAVHCSTRRPPVPGSRQDLR